MLRCRSRRLCQDKPRIQRVGLFLGEAQHRPKSNSYSEHDCALLLGCSLQDIRRARVRDSFAPALEPSHHMDRITAGDIEATKFLDSPYSANSALRSLRRAFHRALDKEILRKIPKIKMLFAPRREVMVSVEDELRLIKAIESRLKKG